MRERGARGLQKRPERATSYQPRACALGCLRLGHPRPKGAKAFIPKTSKNTKNSKTILTDDRVE